MQITFGMASYDDFYGVYMTCMGLLCNHPRELFKLLVVDNNPGSAHSKETFTFCKKVNATYIPYTKARGTAAPRNAIFENADTDYVVCMDSHVMLMGPQFESGFPGGVVALWDYFRAYPDTRDLLTGPQVHDGMTVFNTHFNNEWGAYMQGRWGQAWSCPCRKPDALRFTVKERDTKAAYYALDTIPREPFPAEMDVKACGACGRPLPNTAYAGSYQVLIRETYRPLGRELSDPAFEIPAQGLGLFACRRDAWLGFNPNFRGFGGEEMYIHYKYKKAGHRVMCLPGLQWVHRFQKPDGTKDPNNLYERARNYVLGRQENGLPLEDVKAEFAKPGGVSEAQWDYLLQDPVNHTDTKQCAECNPNKSTIPTAADSRLPQPTGSTIDDIYDSVKAMPRDLDRHLPALRKLAGMCEHITEFTKRRESAVAFLAGTPGKVVSYCMEPDPLQERLTTLAGDRYQCQHVPSTKVPTIDPTDMLFIDSQHTYRRATEELEKYGKKVRRYIVMHDVLAYGHRGEDGTQYGLLDAAGDFIYKNPEWFVVHYATEQHGLLILGTDTKDGVWAKPIRQMDHGPGTELKGLLAGLGVTEKPGCDCKAKAAVMDTWGVAGCLLRFPIIVQWLNEGKERWGWEAKFGAALSAIATGLAWQLNPFDPIPGLVRRAIELARTKDENKLHNADVQPVPTHPVSG
jgi:glycosyltransferase involved in cell wall biosynthesis